MRVRTMLKPRQMPTAGNLALKGSGCAVPSICSLMKTGFALRQMIMAVEESGGKKRWIFCRCADLPAFHYGWRAVIRLLDPPLHEFLPHSDEELAEAAKATGVSAELARQRALRLKGQPDAGHRGCRLAITYPEICAMQARAIFEAAVGSLPLVLPIPEIMVPLAGTAKEIEIAVRLSIMWLQVFAKAGRR